MVYRKIMAIKNEICSFLWIVGLTAFALFMVISGVIISLRQLSEVF